MRRNHLTTTKPRRSPIVAAIAAMALLATACETYVDHHSVLAVDAQENGFFEDGDELILATIDFRSTPGVAGSTVVHFNNGSLDKAATGLEDGDRRTIANSRGLYVFDDITVVGLPGLLSGTSPEIIGQLVIAIENDLTPRDLIKDIMEDVRDELGLQIAAIIEPLEVADLLADPAALTESFAAASAAVQAAAEPSLINKILIGLSSFGNPDDLIDFNFLFFVPVTPGLAGFVDNAFADLPAGVVGGAFPTTVVDGEIVPRRLVLTFQGDGAHYEVTTYVGGGDAGFIVPPPPPPWDPCNPSVGIPPPPPRPVCP